MNKNFKPDRSSRSSRVSANAFHGNISRRAGNMRSAVLEGGTMNADQIFDLADAIQESIDITFGKVECGVQPEIDRKLPKPKGNVIYAFDKTSALTTAAVILMGLATLTVPAYATNRNVERVLASQADLSLFTQALHNTGVSDELNPDTEYTIFAPTNAAFTAIQPRAYPCFYSAQCRVEIAAILRNHIVPRNETINAFSKWGGDIPTLGNRELYVEENLLSSSSFI